MAITVLRGSWQMAQDLWSLRWAAIKESGDGNIATDLIARIQWETSGQLLEERFLVIMAYDGVVPVGYASLCQGHIAGLHSQQGLYVVGWYLKPDYRRGPASTCLNRAVAKVAKDMGVPRLQGTVKDAGVGRMLERHGFKAVGTVYEWEVPDGRELRPEAGQEVHRQAGEGAPGGAAAHAPGPPLSGGAAACQVDPGP